MMEFITSRAALIMCGVVLMAAVAVPISGIYSDEGSDRVDRIAEADAEAIDAFISGTADEMLLDGSTLLPSAGYSLEADGYFLKVTDPDGNVHQASVSRQIGKFTLGYGETVILPRDSGWTTEPEETTGEGYDDQHQADADTDAPKNSITITCS